MTKKDKLKQAILTGKIKSEKDLLAFVMDEKKKEALKKEILGDIKDNLPKQEDEEIEVTLEII
jgi:hypothetical protein